MTEMKKCQFCGALLTADAETCLMCGSPTSPPPEPTYTTPEPAVPAEPAIPSEPAEPAEPAFAPPEPEYKAPGPTFTAPEAPQTPSNRGLAVAVEIGAGIFGFLGIGWMIAGKLGLGIGLLIGWWIAIAIYAIILTLLSPFTLGLSFFGLCLLPVVPVISGVILNNQLNQ